MEGAVGVALRGVQRVARWMERLSHDRDNLLAGSMRKKTVAILAGAVLAISWLLTGGCVGFELKYRFVESYNENYRPWIRVEIASNYRTSGIPFLFTYTEDVPPYDAKFIYYTQDVVEGAELGIDRI